MNSFKPFVPSKFSHFKHEKINKENITSFKFFNPQINNKPFENNEILKMIRVSTPISFISNVARIKHHNSPVRRKSISIKGLIQKAKKKESISSSQKSDRNKFGQITHHNSPVRRKSISIKGLIQKAKKKESISPSQRSFNSRRKNDNFYSYSLGKGKKISHFAYPFLNVT